VKALLLATSLAVVAPPSDRFEDNSVTSREWRFVCKAMDVMGYAVDCRKLKPPTVVVSLIVQDAAPPGLQLRGVTYRGEQYVFVNARLSREDQRTVVVHETVHYVLDATYGKHIGGCEHEWAARVVHTAWEGSDYDNSWRVWYGC
jgi:hypothetical protein